MIQPIAATLSLEVVATGVRNRTYEQRLKALVAFMFCVRYMCPFQSDKSHIPTVLLIGGINSGMGICISLAHPWMEIIANLTPVDKIPRLDNLRMTIPKEF